jgi:cell division septation protein DedD
VTDLSHDAPDDGFHEIQLSGKQLVFLFMATTVVSVVIFLCGVLVGRGVRGEPLSAEGAAPQVSTSGAGVSSANPATPPPPIGDVTRPANSGLTYTDRLGSEKPVSEKIKDPSVKTPAPEAAPPAIVAPPPAPEQVVAKKDNESKPVAPPAVTAAVPAAAEGARPKAGVWAVQVVALTDQAAATAVVRRLSSKGYPAFLVQPQSGAGVQNYKVQVGKFEDRSEAEVVAGRLKKEEQFQPWILR